MNNREEWWWQVATGLCLKINLSDSCLGYGTVSFLCNLARTTIACITAVRKLHSFAGGLFNFLDSSTGFMWHLEYNFFFCDRGLFQTDSEWEGIDVKNRATDAQLGNLEGWEQDRVLRERLTQWVWVCLVSLVLWNLLAGDVTRINLCPAVPQWMNSCEFKVWSHCQRPRTAQLFIQNQWPSPLAYLCGIDNGMRCGSHT